ncbi:hypothetical protein D3C78_1770950 [compost metagenome]
MARKGPMAVPVESSQRSRPAGSSSRVRKPAARDWTSRLSPTCKAAREGVS